MSLQVGDVLDRYRVEEIIGHGGMAVVYRVTHVRLKSDHALKVLTIDSAAIKRRLLQEGQAQARLRHPNIVSVTDVIDVRGAPGLIMELVEGPTLEEHQRRQPLTLRQVDAVATGILAGVAEAHAQGLIHRDLKPSNVMLDRTSSGLVPKICDFGLVKVLEEERSLSRTKAGVTMGTPRYMSPEQIRDAKNVDERADVFSLGALLYEMVTRTQAFPGEDPIALFKAIDSGSYTPPKALVPDLPSRMEQAIVGALVQDRDERIGSVAALMGIWTGRGEAAYRDARDAADLRQLPVPATHATLGGAAPAGQPSHPAGGAQGKPSAPVQLGQDAPPTLLRDPNPETGSRTGWRSLLAVLAVLVLAGVWTLRPVSDPALSEPAGVGAALDVPDAAVQQGSPSFPSSSRSPASALVVPAVAPRTDEAPATVERGVGPTPPRAAPSPAAPSRGSREEAPAGASPAGTLPSAEPALAADPVDETGSSSVAATAASPGGTGNGFAKAKDESAEGRDHDPTLARVRFTGARQAWLERGGEQVAPGAVPAGTYTVTVYFEGVDPVLVGEFEFLAGEERVLACSSRLRSCR